MGVAPQGSSAENGSILRVSSSVPGAMALVAGGSAERLPGMTATANSGG